MTLEQLQDEWAKDSKIDKTILNELLMSVPSQVQKWGRYWSTESLRYRSYVKTKNHLKIKLREAILGVMPQKEMVEEGIELNTPVGLKITDKSELMKEYLETHPKMEDIDDKIHLQQLKLETISSAVNSLKYREKTLVDLMQFQKWSEGFN